MMKKNVLGTLLLMALVWFLPGVAFSGDVVEKTVYLLVRQRELVAFSAVGNRWVTQNLISGERVQESKFDGRGRYYQPEGIWFQRENWKVDREAV
jgi:hypothetical protein